MRGLLSSLRPPDLGHIPLWPVLVASSKYLFHSQCLRSSRSNLSLLNPNHLSSLCRRRSLPQAPPRSHLFLSSFHPFNLSIPSQLSLFHHEAHDEMVS